MSSNINNATVNRRVVTPESEPDRDIRVGTDVYDVVALKDLPNKIGEIASQEIMRIHRLSTSGIILRDDDVDRLGKLAALVNSISSAHARLNKDGDDPAKLSDEELKRLASG